MLLQSLNAVTGTFIQQLCDEACPESLSLEFKRDLPGSSDRDKHELCKDVSALANADGGDIVYGIDEKSGAANAIAPIVGEAPDAAARRLAQVLDAGIEPRVRGLSFRHVDVPGGYVLVVRVSASFEGPHCIRTNNNRRFVLRNGTGVADMSFDQIRSAFDRTATLSEQARRFVAERRKVIADGDSAFPLMEGPQFVLHMVPISGLSGRRAVDLRPIYHNYTEFIGPNWGGGSRSLNLDGLIVHPGAREGEGIYAYNHIFRSGALEAVSLGGFTRDDAAGARKQIVWSLDMSNFFHGWTEKFVSVLKSWGFAGPAVVALGILNVKGYELGVEDRFYMRRGAADRQHLFPSDAWIEDIEAFDLDEALRPLLDTLWQAFGRERCLDFNDTTGKFAPRRM
jgi:hypothetical protein